MDIKRFSNEVLAAYHEGGKDRFLKHRCVKSILRAIRIMESEKSVDYRILNIIGVNINEISSYLLDEEKRELLYWEKVGKYEYKEEVQLRSAAKIKKLYKELSKIEVGERDFEEMLKDMRKILAFEQQRLQIAIDIMNEFKKIPPDNNRLKREFLFSNKSMFGKSNITMLKDVFDDLNEKMYDEEALYKKMKEDQIKIFKLLLYVKEQFGKHIWATDALARR
jgi:hypothetical protein